MAKRRRDSPLSLRPNLFSKSSAVKVPKQKCVDTIISTKINSHSGSDSCLKMRPPCWSPRISSPAMPRSVSLTLNRPLEDGRGVRHPKKTIDRVGLTLSEKRCFISALQQEHSVRDICGILGINRSSFYYQPREDPSEAVLRAEIEKFAGRYPRYGIGVSHSYSCVRDTPLAPDASLG